MDIEETKDDRAHNLNNLPHLGFGDNIIDLVNPTRDQVHANINSLRDIFVDNAKNGKRSFLYAFYGGAGAILSGPGQIIVLNSADKTVGYPLENRL